MLAVAAVALAAVAGTLWVPLPGVRPPGAVRWPLRRSGPGRPGPADLIEFLQSLREELAAGSPSRPALVRAAGAVGRRVCPCAVGAATLGGSVPMALREDSDALPGLVALAALWEVSEGSGAAMAESLDRLIAAGEAAQAVSAEVAAQLAGPRASVRLLAGLPAVGLGMGWLMGADSLAWLFGSVWGWGCLVAGLALEAAGLWWVSRLVRSVEEELW